MAKILRITLSAIFLLSSVMKAVNINSFALETRLYLDAYFWDLKSVMSSFETIRMEMVGAIGVCVIEMVIALLAIRHESLPDGWTNGAPQQVVAGHDEL